MRYEWEERTYDSRPMPAPDEAVAGCAPWQGTGAPDFEWYEGCDLRETLARGRRGWQALQIDWEEGGPGQVHLVVGDARRRRERIGGDVTPARVEAIRAALGAPGIQPARDRVGRGIPVEFSLGSHHPLVELEGTGWLLWLETVDDLDAPEWVAWLVSPDGRTRHQLARRPADLGPCDGGGYWCEATGAECDAAGLRAEGRLCVLPLGVRRVAIHERSLALLGSVMVAGHGGMPGLTWFLRAPLAPDTTPPPSP